MSIDRFLKMEGDLEQLRERQRMLECRIVALERRVWIPCNVCRGGGEIVSSNGCVHTCSRCDGTGEVCG